MNIFDIINKPLGWILSLCYTIVPNFALALILFTIIIRVILLPFAIKQQKGVAQRFFMAPKEEAIRKRFANDKNRLNEELMKLYKEENYNPMGGCLPLLIQLPILIGLYNIITRPLTYILGYSAEVIQQIASALGLSETLSSTASNYQIQLAAAMHGNEDKLAFLGNVKLIDFNFFGLNLSQTPGFKGEGLLLMIIPLLAGLTGYLSQKVTMKLTAVGPQAPGMKGMLYVMPLMSIYFTTLVPAGIGLYWSVQSLVIIAQSYLLNYFYNPRKMAAEMEAQSQSGKRKRRADGTYSPAEGQKSAEPQALSPSLGEAQADPSAVSLEQVRKPVSRTLPKQRFPQQKARKKKKGR